MEKIAQRTFHAHVYFEEAEQQVAESLRAQIRVFFRFPIGHLHLKAVGPHPKPMFQVTFTADDLNAFLPWLMDHHGPLSVLIHPFSDEHELDHSVRALWLGDKLEINLECFARFGARQQLQAAAV